MHANSLVIQQEASSGEPTTYAPPDLNRNITEIFGKLINIYRGKDIDTFYTVIFSLFVGCENYCEKSFFS